MEDNKVVVILEDIGSQFRVFGEGLAGLNEKTDRIEADVSVLKEDMAIVKMNVSILKEDVSGLKMDVSGLKEDMVFVKDELASINSKLARKVDVEDFERLEKRVIRLESIVTTR